MEPGTIGLTPPQEGEQRFYNEIAADNLSPLWQRLRHLVPKAPTTAAVPFRWAYDGVVRDHIMRAGQIVTTEHAERRVLILENPGLPGQAAITSSLYAGLQLILPGETAPQHRHSQSALRFVIEGSGAHTTVDGERVIMSPGDLVLTPSWRWHGHGNDSNMPVVWLDGLDIPMVAFFATGFAESERQASQDKLVPSGDNAVRFGNNLLPVDWYPSDSSSPILRYPYERSRETLDYLARTGDPDPCHGHKLRFINPASGGAPMPTIAAFIQRLPEGFSSQPYRSTDGTIFSVVEGEGESMIETTRLSWKARDIFVVPPWHRVSHHCSKQAALFSFSDRPAQVALGLWREEREVAG